MTKDEAFKLVLEALIWADAKGENWEKVVSKAIRGAREDLAQPSGSVEHLEPYRFTDKENWLSGNGRMWSEMHREDGDFPVYTTPPHSFFEDVADELRVEIAELQDHIRLLEKQLAQPQHTAAEGEDTRRAWVGMTEIQQVILVCRFRNDPVKLAMEIERELKEKNNGT